MICDVKKAFGPKNIGNIILLVKSNFFLNVVENMNTKLNPLLSLTLKLLALVREQTFNISWK